MLEVPRRSLILVAGIPGAGKSTLLRRLRCIPGGATVLDSDPLRERLRRVLPPGTPYRNYRAVVHLWHRVRIVLAVLGTLGPVVVHLPATGALTRFAVLALAVLAWRRRHLLWVHTDAEAARRGQRERGRVLGRSCFDRHVRGGLKFGRRLAGGWRPFGWSSVTVLDREVASRGLVLVNSQLAGRDWPALPGQR